jgi:hypothetical protein
VDGLDRLRTAQCMILLIEPSVLSAELDSTLMTVFLSVSNVQMLLIIVFNATLQDMSALYVKEIIRLRLLIRLVGNQCVLPSQLAKLISVFSATLDSTSKKV